LDEPSQKEMTGTVEGITIAGGRGSNKELRAQRKEPIQNERREGKGERIHRGFHRKAKSQLRV